MARVSGGSQRHERAASTTTGRCPSPCSALLLSRECRPLRRRLRPLVWMALEELALDAVAEDGRLVARTSARRVAELPRGRPRHCGRGAAGPPRHGLVVLEREKGPAGRFGLSVYVLGPIAGSHVRRARAVSHAGGAIAGTQATGKPVAAAACVEEPCADRPDAGSAGNGSLPLGLRPTATYVAALAQVTAHCRADALHSCPAPVPALQVPGQGTLDLDGGIA